MMTATIKDQILRDIIATKQPAVDIDAEMQCKTYDIEPYLYTLAINQFNDMGLIRLRSTKRDTTADIKREAIDFVNRGGFVVADEIVNASL